MIQPLDSIVNSDVDEYYPSLSSNGNLYFTAAYSNALGREDIYKSEFINGHYQTPQPIDSNVNSVAYEFNAFISPDENLLIFSSMEERMTTAEVIYIIAKRIRMEIGLFRKILVSI